MKFYRYYSVYYDGGPKVHMEKLHMLKETPKGWWIVPKGWGLYGKHEICMVGGWERWVSKTAVKRYAYPTKEQALSSFVCRKNRQIKILTARLSGAKHELRIAENMKTANELL
ncbi:MAG: hypothetical protein HQ561_04325 [Desulfobacteraceae bacterium]|nr:hypothetical protein [Desulfobacteraceae bacterium]